MTRLGRRFGFQSNRQSCRSRPSARRRNEEYSGPSDQRQTDQTTLLGVVLAAAVAVFVVPGAWDWWNLALGVTLLLILLAFDKDRNTSWLHLLAFGAVAGLCCVVATGVFAELLLEAIGRPVPPPLYAWIEVAGQKYYSLSTEAVSRLKDYETALLWLGFSILGASYAGVRRGKWFSKRAS